MYVIVLLLHMKHLAVNTTLPGCGLSPQTGYFKSPGFLQFSQHTCRAKHSISTPGWRKASESTVQIRTQYRDKYIVPVARLEIVQSPYLKCDVLQSVIISLM